MRCSANVGAYAALLRDEYPPFSWDTGEYPLTLGIERAERQSRFRLFIRIFAIVPNQIVFFFVQLAWFAVTVAVWFVILITGRYPRGLFRFSVGALRWYQRQFAYQFLLRDEYPPYSIRAAARPGQEVLSAIVGLPLFIAYIAISLLPYAGLLGGGTDTVLVQSALTSPALAAEMPTGKANGVRVTILGYNDNTPAPPGQYARLAIASLPSTFWGRRMDSSRLSSLRSCSVCTTMPGSCISPRQSAATSRSLCSGGEESLRASSSSRSRSQLIRLTSSTNQVLERSSSSSTMPTTDSATASCHKPVELVTLSSPWP